MLTMYYIMFVIDENEYQSILTLWINNLLNQLKHIITI